MSLTRERAAEFLGVPVDELEESPYYIKRKDSRWVTSDGTNGRWDDWVRDWPVLVDAVANDKCGRLNGDVVGYHVYRGPWDSVEAGFINIGCHSFTERELQRFALAEGLAPLFPVLQVPELRKQIDAIRIALMEGRDKDARGMIFHTQIDIELSKVEDVYKAKTVPVVIQRSEIPENIRLTFGLGIEGDPISGFTFALYESEEDAAERSSWSEEISINFALRAFIEGEDE